MWQRTSTEDRAMQVADCKGRGDLRSRCLCVPPSDTPADQLARADVRVSRRRCSARHIRGREPACASMPCSALGSTRWAEWVYVLLISNTHVLTFLAIDDHFDALAVRTCNGHPLPCSGPYAHVRGRRHVRIRNRGL